MSRNYKRKGKGKKSGFKRSDSQEEYKVEGVDSEGRTNDPTDYVIDPEIARQVTNLSFQSVLGSTPVANGVVLPTIFIARLNPSFGSSVYVEDFRDTENHITNSDINDRKDAVNMMATKLRTLLSSFSGRTSVYSDSDIVMMIGALASIAEYSEHLRRAFGLVMTYDPRNRAIPKALVDAMGIDFDDLAQNLADYRMKFNMLMTRINQIPLLDNIGFIRKCRKLYQNVYADAPTPMYQMYAMVPYSVWILDEDTFEAGSRLKTYVLSNMADNKMYYHLNVLANMIEKVLMSSTLQIVYADILNLATKVHVPMWKFDFLSEVYAVKPIYDRTFLLQIHNAQVLSAPLTIDKTEFWEANGYEQYSFTDGNGNPVTMNVTDANDVASDPDTGRIIYNPTFTHLSELNKEALIDFDTDAPTPGDIIDALRYTALYSHASIGNTRLGADFIVDVSPVLNDHYMVAWDIRSPQGVVSLSDSPQTKSVGNNTPTKFALQAEKFYMSPFLKLAAVGSGMSPYYAGDTNFCTSVDFRYLMRISQMLFSQMFEFQVKGTTGRDK